MPASVIRLCSQGLKALIRAGVFPEYAETGRFKPDPNRRRAGFNDDQLIILHYADLRGPLYADPEQWRLVKAFVQGFTQSGAGITKLVMPRLWGTMDADFLAVGNSLPGAFQALDFQAQPEPGGRHFSFSLGGGTRMEGLPEPYGKWFQHRDKSPRWGQSVRLRLEVKCVLTSVTAQKTSLDFEMTGFAPWLVFDVGRVLSERLGLRPPLRLADEYLHRHAEFYIERRRVPLPLSLR
jgi:hypothetical protein